MTFPDPPALRASAAILCLLVVTACGDGGGDDGAAPTVISPLGGDSPPTTDGSTTPTTPSAPDDVPTPSAPEEPDDTPIEPDDTTVPDVPPTDPDAADARPSAPDDATEPDVSPTDPDARPTQPDDTTEPDASPVDPDVIEPSVPDDDAPAPLVLDGEWLLACRERDPGAPDGVHAVTTLTIAGGTARLRELAYAEDTCSVPVVPAEFPAEFVELVVDVAIAFPGGTTDTSLGVATNVDLTLGEPTLDGVELNATGLQALDAIGFFDTVHDIALIDGVELYFGDTESDSDRDGGTPERRANRLDLSPFVRQ